jgi:acetyl esterase/lipase
MDQPEKAPLMDAEKAIWWIRTHAKEYQLDPNKVGIMGFSAGGHLASTLGTHYKENLIQASSTISLRPDFMILCYPVISFENSIVHSASKERLIGKNPGDSLVKSYSNETQVSGDTPPTFLMHAANDQSVNVENSIQFFQALQSKGVKSEIHIYQSGGHGFGLLNTTNKDDWFLRLISWLKTNQFL